MGYIGDRSVGFFASRFEIFVVTAKVVVASDRYPGSFDEGPFEPFVATGNHFPLVEFSGTSMGGGCESAIADEFFLGLKPINAINFGGNDAG